MAKERGTCAACRKSPRVLTALDDGQKLCRTCLRDIRPPRPKHLASQEQIDYARKIGYKVKDDILRSEISPILDRHEHAYYYVLDLWEVIVGCRAREQGVDHTLIHRFVSTLSQLEPQLIQQIATIQAERDEYAYEKSDQIRDAIEKGDSSWIRQNPDGTSYTPSLNKLKPSLQPNRPYKSIRKQLRLHFPQFVK